MKAITSLSLLLFVQCVSPHEHHDGPAPGESIKQYAQRHMSSEHHIDSFDTSSFHRLHDLNGDGIWDREEIEALYGVHHVYSTKQSKDEAAQQAKADHIVNKVLEILDLNHDGVVSLEELKIAGIDAVPSFDNMGAEGHHYDVESEFFLHHEEKYHSSPETQTDEAYTHPEDQEHFAMHEKIERDEAEKEAKYQGITVEELMKDRKPHPDAATGEKDNIKPDATPQETPQQAPGVPIARHPHDEQVQAVPPVQEPSPPKVTRVPPPEKQDPSVRYKDASKEAEHRDEYGTGESGYKRPKSAADKMLKNLPYKYKFRRSWGDF